MPSKQRPELDRISSHPSGSRLGRSSSDVSPRSPSVAASTAASTHTGKSSLPRHKIQALESFVKFGRKGKEKAQEPEFPPDEWFRKATPPSASGVQSPSTSHGEVHDSTDIHRILEETWSLSESSPVSLSPSRIGSSFVPSPAPPNIVRVHADGESVSPSDGRRTLSAPNTPMHEDISPPEPMSLARQIQALLYTRSEPAPLSLTNDPSNSSSAGGPPTADLAPADPSLISLLTNPSLMNGKSAGQGVFALLDRLRIRPAQSTTQESPSPAPPHGGTDSDDSDDDGSLMLYAPLEPDETSEVELAASDCMSVYDDGETVEFERPAQRLSLLQALEDRTPSSRRSPLAQSVLSSSPEPEEPPETAPAVEAEEERQRQTWFGTFRDRVVEGGKLVSATLTPASRVAEKPAETPLPEREPVRTRVRWVPSPDKISFQAMWWGYRLYLPPPVLDVLNNKRLEAAKRAALITTALQWLLGDVPLTLVPPQFRIALALTQRLVPYLGYIGAFVAWSWGAMKVFDKGYGVTLTATWLLPIALIPGTFEASEYATATTHSPPMQDDDTTTAGIIPGPSDISELSSTNPFETTT